MLISSQKANHWENLRVARLVLKIDFLNSVTMALSLSSKSSLQTMGAMMAGG